MPHPFGNFIVVTLSLANDQNVIWPIDDILVHRCLKYPDEKI